MTNPKTQAPAAAQAERNEPGCACGAGCNCGPACACGPASKCAPACTCPAA